MASLSHFFFKAEKNSSQGLNHRCQTYSLKKKSNHKKNEKPLPIARSASASPTNQRRPFVRAAVTFVLLCEDRLPPLVRPSNLFPNFFFVFYFGVPLQSGLLRQDYYCLCVSVCVCVCEREREREREPIDRSLKPEGFAGWLGRPATYSMSGAIHRGRYRCHISASTISLGPPRRPPSMPAVFLKPALDLEAHHRQHGPIFFFFSNVKHRFQIEFSPNFVSSSESSVFSWTHLL